MSREAARRGVCHGSVNALGRRSGPRAAALRPEGRRSGDTHVGSDDGEDLGAAAWTACRGATTRRGEAAARVSGSHGDGLGALTWTVCHGAAARRGDAAAMRKSG